MISPKTILREEILMSYSPNLNSGFANTRNRSPYQTSTSGM